MDIVVLFPAPFTPKKAKKLAFVYTQAQIIHSLYVPEGFVQRVYFYNMVHKVILFTCIYF